MRENPHWDSPKTEIPKSGIPKARTPKTEIPKTGRFSAPFVQSLVETNLKKTEGLYARSGQDLYS